MFWWGRCWCDVTEICVRDLPCHVSFELSLQLATTLANRDFMSLNYQPSSSPWSWLHPSFQFRCSLFCRLPQVFRKLDRTSTLTKCGCMFELLCALFLCHDKLLFKRARSNSEKRDKYLCWCLCLRSPVSSYLLFFCVLLCVVSTCSLALSLSPPVRFSLLLSTSVRQVAL